MVTMYIKREPVILHALGQIQGIEYPDAEYHDASWYSQPSLLRAREDLAVWLEWVDGAPQRLFVRHDGVNSIEWLFALESYSIRVTGGARTMPAGSVFS